MQMRIVGMKPLGFTNDKWAWLSSLQTYYNDLAKAIGLTDRGLTLLVTFRDVTVVTGVMAVGYAAKLEALASAGAGIITSDDEDKALEQCEISMLPAMCRH